MAPDTLSQLIAAAAGKTSEQIQEEIVTSDVAESIPDPKALADLLVRCSEDPDFAAQLLGEGEPAADEAPPEEPANPY